jgi:hypothetical protein
LSRSVPTILPALTAARAGTALVAALLGNAVRAPSASAQDALPLLSVELELGQYGLQGAEEVRRGRVAIAWHPTGPDLDLYYVRADPVQPRPPAAEPPPALEPVRGELPVPRHTALWVWRTSEIFADPGLRAAFLRFVEEERITRVFLYLPAGPGGRASAGFVPFDSDQVGPLVADLRAHGALTYALDGDRDYVRRENHAGVYRTVERLVQHNRSVPLEQRFHGVRYDIEPYLAPGFQGPGRQELLDGYVEVLHGASRIAHEGGLAFGADIPFWFDARDEETGAYFEATVNGRSARLIEHVMSAVDDLAIMDYRTEVHGVNGALAHAVGELVMAERMGVDVFVGVETGPVVDEDLYTFHGPAAEGLPPHARARWIVLESGADGRTRLWMVEGQEALSTLVSELRGARMIRHWPAGRPARVAAQAQAFRELGAERFHEFGDEVVRYLSASPAFAGLALHDYTAVTELLGAR